MAANWRHTVLVGLAGFLAALASTRPHPGFAHIWNQSAGSEKPDFEWAMGAPGGWLASWRGRTRRSSARAVRGDGHKAGAITANPIVRQVDARIRTTCAKQFLLC